MRALAILLALPAACQNQPPATANAVPPAPAVNVVAPGNDLAIAEATVRRQLGNPHDIEFTDALARRDDRVVIVCGWFTRRGRDERYIVVDGRGAWVESEMRPGEMDRAVGEFCRPGPGRSMRRAS